MTERIEQFERLVRDRRTSMAVDPGREVSADDLQRVAELAVWAPNYKRTNPWRFAAFVGDGRTALGEAFATVMEASGETDPARLAKARTKYTRTPAIIVIGCDSSGSPELHTDNLYAVAAGIQNMLLGATALGLASYWSTAPIESATEIDQLCGFAVGTVLVGVIYLGWPAPQPTAAASGQRDAVAMPIIAERASR